MSLKKLIVCVCRGNILRSAVAEKLISHHIENKGLGDRCNVISRSIQGTIIDTKRVTYPNLTYYTEVYQRIKPVLDDLNVDLTRHVSKAINLRVANKATVILAMDLQTKSALIKLFPNLIGKIHLFSDMAELEKDVSDVPYNTKPTYSIKAVMEIQNIINSGKHNILALVGY